MAIAIIFRGQSICKVWWRVGGWNANNAIDGWGWHCNRRIRSWMIQKDGLRNPNNLSISGALPRTHSVGRL